MRHVRSYRLFGLAAALVVLIGAFRLGGDTRPAYACTGGPGPFEETAREADVIVIAQAVEVGGPENAAPTVTPMPTPAGGPQLPSGDWSIDLEGIGATLQVIQAIGTVPVEIEVDSAARKGVEENLRRLEANPNTIMPCPPDFGVQRYVEGQTYIIFLTRDQDGGWFTYLRWETDGPDMLTGGSFYEGGRPALAVTREVLGTYFTDLPAWSFDPGNPESAWLVHQQRIPLEAVLAAILGIRSGLPLMPDPSWSPVEPPPAELACNRSLEVAEGGEVITWGHLSVTMPASGSYSYRGLVVAPGGPALRICHLETASIITISDVTGAEISRVGESDAGTGILDQILASVALTSGGGQISPPHVPSELGRITPPDTGDAGLK